MVSLSAAFDVHLWSMDIILWGLIDSEAKLNASSSHVCLEFYTENAEWTLVEFQRLLTYFKKEFRDFGSF